MSRDLLMSLLLPLLLGYLLGSIPFGLVLTRAAGLGDVRKIGSGNIGATNVLRTGNKGLALATLLLDGLKGAVAVWLADRFLGTSTAVIDAGALGKLAPGGLAGIVAGLGAVLGHMFPVWLGFKGGKGVATYIGALIGLFWHGALIFCAVWLVVAVITRYSSVSSLAASTLTPIYFLATGQYAVGWACVAVAVLVFIKHHGNISRLLAGTESKIGAKA